jgi:hypothetical protein
LVGPNHRSEPLPGIPGTCVNHTTTRLATNVIDGRSKAAEAVGKILRRIMKVLLKLEILWTKGSFYLRPPRNSPGYIRVA